MQNGTQLSNLIDKGFSLSLTNIWRNKFLSLATIFVIATILFIFNIILAINFIAQESLNDLNKKVDVVVYLKDSTTELQAQKIIEDLKLTEGVAEVNFNSKEDALNKLNQSHPDISTAFEKYELGNPLPASINIITTDPAYHSAIDEMLKQEKYKLYLSDIQSTGDENDSVLNSVSKNLMKLSDFTHQIIFWLILTFMIGGALITINALQITIFNRRKDIQIMKLVGASPWFIRFPFIIEAIIYGLSALILSTIMLFVLSTKLNLEFLNFWTSIGSGNFYFIFLVELLVTVALTILSSLIAVHEHLIRKSL